MVDLATLIPTAMAGGGLTWAGTAIVQWMKNRGEESSARLTTEADLAKHQDSLTFQLLAAARTDLASLRARVEFLQPMEEHLYHLQQALEHIEALLGADEGSRVLIERGARAFLNRMRRQADAAGTLANEAQRLASEISLSTDGDKVPPPPGY